MLLAGIFMFVEDPSIPCNMMGFAKRRSTHPAKNLDFTESVIDSLSFYFLTLASKSINSLNLIGLVKYPKKPALLAC